MNVLLTGTGFPATRSIVMSLKSHYLQDITIIGIDQRDNALSRAFVDKFYQCPPATDIYFAAFIYDLCKSEKISVILPTVTAELEKLLMLRPRLTSINVSLAMGRKTNYAGLNNKWALMVSADKFGIPVPLFKRINERSDLWNVARDIFNYPTGIFCIKPIESNGGRGFRIIDEHAGNSYYTDKNITRMRLDDFLNQLPIHLDCPLVAMEYLPGTEYSVDLLADRGKCIYVIPRTRDYVKEGISFVSTTVEHHDIIEYCRVLVDAYRVHGPCGFQFKEDKEQVPRLIECNPRLQGGSVASVMAGGDLFVDSVRLSMGEEVKKPEIKWGVKMIRYYDEIFI